VGGRTALDPKTGGPAALAGEMAIRRSVEEFVVALGHVEGPGGDVDRVVADTFNIAYSQKQP
jgi:hypothetical protein